MSRNTEARSSTPLGKQVRLHPNDRDLPDSEQYPVWKILAIWAASAIPMGVGLWWITPTFLVGRMEIPGVGWLVLATAGLIWQAVLAYAVLRLEGIPFTRAGLTRRLWLGAPVSPRTGRARKRYLWWALAAALVYLAIDMTEILQPVNDLLTNALPALNAPDYALIENLAVPEIEGQWWLMGLLVVLILSNYLLGEELIFRGILLPKMHGAFGRLDVIMNGVLFATYHVHLIWAMPAMLITDWIYPYLTKRYRSYWMGVVFHGIDAIFLLVLFPLAITGVVTS